MTVQKIAGRYVALQRNPQGGGYIASGTTHAGAIVAMLNMIAFHSK